MPREVAREEVVATMQSTILYVADRGSGGVTPIKDGRAGKPIRTGKDPEWPAVSR